MLLEARKHTQKIILKGGPSSVHKSTRVLILFCMLRTIYRVFMRIGYFYYDIILLVRPESFRVLLSSAN